MSAQAKTLLFGDDWTGLLYAFTLLQHEIPFELWLSGNGPFHDPDPVPVFVGNGETREQAGRIYGEQLATSIWSLSEASWDGAHRLFSDLCFPAYEKGLERIGKGGAVERGEPGLSFGAADLASALHLIVSRKGVPVHSFTRLERVEARRGLEFTIHFTDGEKAGRVTGVHAIIATEKYERASMPWLSDKRIPITLSSFQAFSTSDTGASVTLLNNGADFAVHGENRLRLGSYRNLHEDRGVGIQSTTDSKTEGEVRRFFSDKGWISPDVSLERCLSVESVSCDGLPILGPIPGLPGVVFVTGLSARGPCFVFEIVNRVAESIGSGKLPGLEAFSTKRLV